SPSASVLYPLSLHDALPILGLARLYQAMPFIILGAMFPGGSVLGNIASRAASAVLNVGFDYVMSRITGQPYGAEDVRNSLIEGIDRKSTRLNSSHGSISYAV